MFSVSHVYLNSQVGIKINSFSTHEIGYKLWHYRVHQRKTGKYSTWVTDEVCLYCIVISTGYTSSEVSTNCVFSDMISGLYGSGSWAVQRNVTFITGTRVTYQLVMLAFMSTLYLTFSIWVSKNLCEICYEVAHFTSVSATCNMAATEVYKHVRLHSVF